MDAKLKDLDKNDLSKVNYDEIKFKYLEETPEEYRYQPDEFQTSINPSDIRLDKDFFQNVQILNTSDAPEHIANIIDKEFPDILSYSPEITDSELQAIRDIKNSLSDLQSEDIVERIQDLKSRINKTYARPPKPLIYDTPLKKAIIETDYEQKRSRSDDVTQNNVNISDIPQMVSEISSNISKFEDNITSKLDETSKILKESVFDEARLSSLEELYAAHLPSKEEIDDAFSEELFLDSFDEADGNNEEPQGKADSIQNNIDGMVSDSLQQLLLQQQQIENLNKRIGQMVNQQNELSKILLQNAKINDEELSGGVTHADNIDRSMSEISSNIKSLLTENKQEQSDEVVTKNELYDIVNKTVSSIIDQKEKEQREALGIDSDNKSEFSKRSGDSNKVRDGLSNILEAELPEDKLEIAKNKIENIQEKIDAAQNKLQVVQEKVDAARDKISEVEQKIYTKDINLNINSIPQPPHAIKHMEAQNVEEENLFSDDEIQNLLNERPEAVEIDEQDLIPTLKKMTEMQQAMLQNAWSQPQLQHPVVYPQFNPADIQQQQQYQQMQQQISQLQEAVHEQQTHVTEQQAHDIISSQKDATKELSPTEIVTDGISETYTSEISKENILDLKRDIDHIKETIKDIPIEARKSENINVEREISQPFIDVMNKSDIKKEFEDLRSNQKESTEAFKTSAEAMKDMASLSRAFLKAEIEEGDDFFDFSDSEGQDSEKPKKQSFFKADEEEVVKIKVDKKKKKKRSAELDMHGLVESESPMLFESETSEDKEDEFKFLTLEELMENESIVYNSLDTLDTFLTADRLANNHPDIIPGFFPDAYVPYEDYTHVDGFFIDESGNPLKAPEEEKVHVDKVEAEIVGFDEGKARAAQRETRYNPSEYFEGDENYRKKKQKHKQVRLSYNFRYLFNNKTYRKYKTILNEAAQLVAEQKLDEALEYYYVVRDQNIPEAFKMMIQQNIDHIISTMVETFQFSDTIVRVKDSGEVVRLKGIEEEEEEEKVLSQ